MSCERCRSSTVPIHLVQEEDDTLPTGTVINARYRIEALIGEGAFGKVYLAYQLDLDRRVALKTLKKQFLADKSFVKRFYREARAVSRLEHPSIVKIFDFGTDPEHELPFLVMEYLEGGTLRAHLDTHGALPEAEACELLADVARGLVEAHRRGVIHRDLKPDNIWLRTLADGETQVKVLDFGIAKALTDERGQTLTKTGTPMGTPQCLQMANASTMASSISGRG